jgi:hypothetical protein
MEPRARSAATLGALVVLCLLGILFGIRALTADLPDEPLVESSTAPCEDRTIADGKKIRADEITVSVYNGGVKAGAASRVMKELQTRGFVAGESGNAPKGSDVIRVQIWADRPKNAAARLVARQFGPGIRVFGKKPTLGPGIVVVIGDEIGPLVKAPGRTTAVGPTKVCSPPVS